MTHWHRVYPGLFAFLSLLPLSATARAATVFVDVNAPGATQDGASWATAFKTIQSAVAAAVPGDEIWVAGGTYRESFTIPAALALYGGFSGTETARGQRNIRANQTSIVWEEAGIAIYCTSANATISGFHIRAMDYGIATNTTGESTTTISNNVISGCRVGASVVGMAAVLSRNVISGNVTGVESAVDSLILTGNTISGNTLGVFTYFVAGLQRTATLIGNTVTGNNNGLQLELTHLTLVNNIVAFNGLTGVYRRGGSWTYLAHNDVFGNGVRNYDGISDPTGQNGNISVDPALSNIYRNIHLQPDSPCRNAGDGDAESAVTDIDGQPRIQEGTIDIGSDESDGTPWTVTSRVWFVSTDGNDANDGASWATAKRTITATLPATQGGDEVWVAKGSYAEKAAVPPGVAIYGGFAGTETTRSQRNIAANTAVVAPADPTWTVLSFYNSGGRVDGLTFRGAISAIDVRGQAVIANCVVTESSGAVTVSSGAAILTGNTLSGNDQGFSAFNSTVVLEENVVENNLFQGIYVAQNSTATIVRNTVAGNHGVGLRVRESTADAHDNLITRTQGVAVKTESAAAYLHNNTIALGGAGGTGITVEGSQAHLTNNVIAYHELDGVRLIGTSNVVVMLRNGVFGNSPNYTNVPGVQVLSNIHEDPLLVDQANGDFHLQAGSPLIDEGNDTVVKAGDLDLDGRPRILGAHVDVGAFEALPPGFVTLTDVIGGLRIAGGLSTASPGDLSRLNIAEPGTPRISVHDASRLVRKAAGLDANP